VAEARDEIRLCQQEDFLFGEMSGREHMQMVGMLRNVKKDGVIAELAEKLGLEELLDQKVEKLSAGNRRLISIAMALIGDAKLIIMDEPTANLDPISRNMVWDVLLEIKKKYSILIST
jgi:ATP-binding cassette subfamily A (ABC1) protein 3